MQKVGAEPGDEPQLAETACTGTPAECEAEKAKHRAKEAKEGSKDKLKEVKNKVD